MSFLEALSCKEVTKPPVWLMRQAGRYLPEYRALRERHTLATLFHEPELAALVTLMPLKRFSFDAAIVFSDLLVLAEVWGKKVVYPEAGGPYIEPKVESGRELFAASKDQLATSLSYVLKTINLVKPELSVPLIGFCGAPFTLLCYLLERKGGGDFSPIRTWIQTRPEELSRLLDCICSTAIAYVELQVEAGVEAVQIFDSWTHLLSQEEFLLYALPYWDKMQKALKSLGVPLLFFSRSNSLYPELISSIKPSGISFDEGKSLQLLREKVPKDIAVQGNFSPHLLATGSIEEIQKEARKMAESVRQEKGIIFNLGHGVLPNTPIDNVHALLEGLYD